MRTDITDQFTGNWECLVKKSAPVYLLTRVSNKSQEKTLIMETKSVRVKLYTEESQNCKFIDCDSFSL